MEDIKTQHLFIHYLKSYRRCWDRKRQRRRCKTQPIDGRLCRQKRSMSWVNSVLRQFLTNGPSIYSLFSSKLPGFTTALFQRKPGKVNYARNEKETRSEISRHTR